jgi:hypothetical protein
MTGYDSWQPQDDDFAYLMIEEQPRIIRAGDVCKCGHLIGDHHENQVTGESTDCLACEPGGCRSFRPQTQPEATP